MNDSIQIVQNKFGLCISFSFSFQIIIYSELTRLLFHVHDDPVLNNLNDDGQKIEPEW